MIGQHLAELYDILTGQQATIKWAGIRDSLLTMGTYDSKLEELSLLLGDLPRYLSFVKPVAVLAFKNANSHAR